MTPDKIRKGGVLQSGQVFGFSILPRLLDISFFRSVLGTSVMWSVERPACRRGIVGQETHVGADAIMRVKSQRKARFSIM